MHLERMGDLAVNIAKAAQAHRRRARARRRSTTSSRRRATSCTACSTRLVEALEKRDLELARKLPELDEPIDHLYKQFFRELARLHDEEEIEWASSMVLASRYLERIADNAVDIGERIAYLITGEFDERRTIADAERSSPWTPSQPRYEAVRRQVADAADVRRARPGDDVTIVAVTKTVGIEEIRQAIAAGIRDFGENRVAGVPRQVRAVPRRATGTSSARCRPTRSRTSSARRASSTRSTRCSCSTTIDRHAAESAASCSRCCCR